MICDHINIAVQWTKDMFLINEAFSTGYLFKGMNFGSLLPQRKNKFRWIVHLHMKSKIIKLQKVQLRISKIID